MDLPKELIIYKINNFLSLKEKINFRLFNKKISKIQEQVIWFHLGEILVKKLGFDMNDAEEDLKLCREDRWDAIKEISNICLKESDYYKKKQKSHFRLLLKPLIKIQKSNIDDCKKIIKEDILTISKKSVNNTLTPNYFKNNYYTTYAIIL